MAHRILLGAAALIAVAGTAQAACREDIAQLEAQSSQKATSAIAGSSGQAAAAQKEASQRDHDPANQAMQAKVALDDAKVALSKGDEAACEAAVGRARSNVKN